METKCLFIVRSFSAKQTRSIWPLCAGCQIMLYPSRSYILSLIFSNQNRLWSCKDAIGQLCQSCSFWIFLKDLTGCSHRSVCSSVFSGSSNILYHIFPIESQWLNFNCCRCPTLRCRGSNPVATVSSIAVATVSQFFIKYSSYSSWAIFDFAVKRKKSAILLILNDPSLFRIHQSSLIKTTRLQKSCPGTYFSLFFKSHS